MERGIGLNTVRGRIVIGAVGLVILLSLILFVNARVTSLATNPCEGVPDGQSVPGSCTGPCKYCQGGQCVTVADGERRGTCTLCQACSGGVCTNLNGRKPGICSLCKQCVNGLCIYDPAGTLMETTECGVCDGAGGLNPSSTYCPGSNSDCYCNAGFTCSSCPAGQVCDNKACVTTTTTTTTTSPTTTSPTTTSPTTTGTTTTTGTGSCPSVKNFCTDTCGKAYHLMETLCAPVATGGHIGIMLECWRDQCGQEPKWREYVKNRAQLGTPGVNPEFEFCCDYLADGTCVDKAGPHDNTLGEGNKFYYGCVGDECKKICCDGGIKRTPSSTCLLCDEKAGGCYPKLSLPDPNKCPQSTPTCYSCPLITLLGPPQICVDYKCEDCKEVFKEILKPGEDCGSIDPNRFRPGEVPIEIEKAFSNPPEANTNRMLQRMAEAIRADVSSAGDKVNSEAKGEVFSLSLIHI